MLRAQSGIYLQWYLPLTAAETLLLLRESYSKLASPPEGEEPPPARRLGSILRAARLHKGLCRRRSPATCPLAPPPLTPPAAPLLLLL